MPPLLAEVLDAFGDALLDPARPVPAGVFGPDRRPDAKRFDVYRNNVVHGLVNALEARFPVTSRLVGRAFFRSMARVYAAAHRPRTPLLMHYGDDFPRFIADFTPAAPLPYLPDVARLERAWSQAYHAVEADSVDVRSLARLRPEKLAASRLRLHPSLRLLRSPHPVATIWSAHQTAGDVIPPAGWEAEDVLVVRPQAEVRIHLLPAGGYEFVVALAAGSTVQVAAEAAQAHSAEFDAGDHLVGLAGLGVIASIDAASAQSKTQRAST